MIQINGLTEQLWLSNNSVNFYHYKLKTKNTNILYKIHHSLIETLHSPSMQSILS